MADVEAIRPYVEGLREDVAGTGQGRFRRRYKFQGSITALGLVSMQDAEEPSCVGGKINSACTCMRHSDGQVQQPLFDYG